MNEVINTLNNHRTYRDFDPNFEIPKADLAAILKAARQAPTWMNGQFYSIIVIKNQKIREKLLEWNPTNTHLGSCSELLLFVADLQRSKRVSEAGDAAFCVTDNLDALLVATTDTALAGENAVIAAESLGYGSVVAGSIRKNAENIIQLLELPAYTYPLFTISIGKPTVEMQVKPRLPEKAVVFEDKYDNQYDYQVIEDYVETMEIFAEARETKTWTKKFQDFFADGLITGTNKGLKKQKFIK